MDIELIETDALLLELMKRYDYAVFYGIAVTSYDTLTTHDRWQYKGNARMCRGLTLDLMDKLKETITEVKGTP